MNPPIVHMEAMHNSVCLLVKQTQENYLLLHMGLTDYCDLYMIRLQGVEFYLGSTYFAVQLVLAVYPRISSQTNPYPRKC